MEEQELAQARQEAAPDHLVVGIGASAGGFEALREFLQALPPKPGVALVLIQHVGESERGLLAEVFDARAKLPVSEIQEDVRIEKDRLYIAPPDAIVRIRAGRWGCGARPACAAAAGGSGQP